MGSGNVHPILIKSMAEVFVKPLIFQKSVSSGTLPTAWKEAGITLTFKKQSKTEPSDGWLVSLTSVLCKTLENLVCKSIIEHLNENNLLSERQYGFCSNRSCALLLYMYMYVMERWTDYVEQGQSWDMVYLGLAKAFDKVSHQRLRLALEVDSFLWNKRRCSVMDD